MNNLRKLRKSAGYTQAQLADKLAVHQTLISQIERETVIPSGSTLVDIAKFFKVSTDYVLGIAEDSSSELVKKAIRIPILGRVPAGIPLEAIQEVIDYEEIPAEMGKGGAEYFGLLVKGDSMYPRYLDGDVIIVRKQSTCESGQDCVVYVNGYDATLKTVYLLDDGGIKLQPYNQLYPPKTYYPGDEPIAIAGVVVELRRKMMSAK